MHTPGPLISRRRFLATLGAGTAACAWPRWGGALPTADASPHEAAFYEKEDDGTVHCRLCPRGCRVREGQRGYCRVRENRAGKYYSLIYGRPCAMHLDPIEKKPFFHVYPGSQAYSIATVGCVLSCKFCQNWDISQAKPEDVSVPYRSPESMAAAATRSGARVMAYTYGEPIVFHEYMTDCARTAQSLGLDNVMVSSGFIREPALRALFPLMKAIKIDLKAFTQEFYEGVCGGALQPVLNTLSCLASAGVWYEIVVLIIPTLNDAPDEIKRLAAWVVKELGPDVPLHFSRFHPTYKMKNIPPTPLATLQRTRNLALGEGCRYVYIGNVPGAEGQDTVCPECKAMLIRRYGYRILENNLQDGRCPACRQLIPGVWS